MYPPTPVPREALASRQPRVAPTLSPSPPSTSPRCPRGSRLDETFDSFGGNLHNPCPPPSPPFSIFSSLRRPIHRVSTRSTLSYRSPSEHTYSPPLTRRSHCERQQRDRPRGFLQNGGGKGWQYILLSFFWTVSGASIFDDYTSRPGHAPMWRADKITFAAVSFRDELYDPAHCFHRYFPLTKRIVIRELAGYTDEFLVRIKVLTRGKVRYAFRSKHGHIFALVLFYVHFFKRGIRSYIRACMISSK